MNDVLSFSVGFDAFMSIIMSNKSGTSGARKRPQKHQNSFAWKADKHKSDPKTKLVQSLTVINCCQHCTGVIEWKIKYGKYKPLNKPSKCLKCGERKVKYAYHILCQDCVTLTGFCAKCGKVEEIINSPQPSLAETARLDSELQQELKGLPERKRRTFLRYIRNQEKKSQSTPEESGDTEESVEEPEIVNILDVKKEALSKLKDLKEKLGVDQDFDDLDFDSLSIGSDSDDE